MNIYIVIEGEKATKKLYTNWISYVNRQLKPIDYITDFKENNFYILSGFGQPGFWQVVNNAVDDVNNCKEIDRLVISIDSEDNSYENVLSAPRACYELLRMVDSGDEQKSIPQ